MASNTVDEEYAGIHPKSINFKTYLKDRIRNWLTSLRQGPPIKEERLKLHSVPAAHSDWHPMDDQDTEHDADSEYEIDKRQPENDTLQSAIKPVKDNAVKSVAPTDLKLNFNSPNNLVAAFDGSGTEPNATVIVPAQMWEQFLPKARPR